FRFQVLEYPTRSSSEIVDDGVGLQTRLRPGLFACAVSRAHENPARADRSRQTDVEPLVADDERSRRIESKVLRGAIDQGAARLTTLAFAREFRDHAVRMMRAMIIRVDRRPAGGERRGELAVNVGNDRFGE